MTSILLAIFLLQAEPVAVYDSGAIYPADMVRFVRKAYPEGLNTPAGDQWEAWIQTLIGQTGGNALLASHPLTKTCTEAPQQRAQVIWKVASQLASEVKQGFRDQAAPDEASLEQRMKKLSIDPDRTMIRFRSIYLKTSGAGAIDDKTAESLLAKVQSELKTTTFAIVARKYSQGATAAKGGLVQWVPLARLDKTVAEVLAKLAEGQIAPPLKTRTGIHILKLENRRSPSPDEVATLARESLVKEGAQSFEDGLISRLMAEYPFRKENGGWQLESFSLSKDEVSELITLVGSNHLNQAKNSLERTLYLAWSTLRLTDTQDPLWKSSKIEAQDQCRKSTLNHLIEEEVAAVPESRLRSFFKSHEERFQTTRGQWVSIWFFDQGPDAFATQLDMEALAKAAGTEGIELKGTDPKPLRVIQQRMLLDAQIAELHPNIYRAIHAMKPGATSAPVYCPKGGNMLGPQGQWTGGFAIATYHKAEPARQLTFNEAGLAVKQAFASQHRMTLAQQALENLLTLRKFRIKTLPSRSEIEKLIQ